MPKLRAPRDGARQVLVVLAIGMALTLGLLATNEYVNSRQRAAAAAAAALNDDEIYTGSILYMPDEGRFCHQVLFDNHTGVFTDNGNVDCERASYHSAVGTPKQWSAARVRVISTGFRQR
jgi:hypothetical protein